MSIDELLVLVDAAVNAFEEENEQYEVSFIVSDDVGYDIEKVLSPGGSEKYILKVYAPKEVIDKISSDYSETSDIVHAISSAVDYFQSIVEDEEELEMEGELEELDEEEDEETEE